MILEIQQRSSDMGWQKVKSNFRALKLSLYCTMSLPAKFTGPWIWWYTLHHNVILPSLRMWYFKPVYVLLVQQYFHGLPFSFRDQRQNSACTDKLNSGLHMDMK